MPRGFSPGLKSHNDLDFDCVMLHRISYDQGLSSYRDKMLIDDVVIPSNARNLS